MSTYTRTTEQSMVFGYQCKARELKEFMEDIPDDADIHVSRYEGDAREPTETRITATHTTRGSDRASE